MALVMTLPPPDATAAVTNTGTVQQAGNDPNSGQAIPDTAPAGPQPRAWSDGRVSNTGIVIAVAVVLLAAIGIWLVIKKMK